MLYGMDLFSGYGGISLGLKQWVKPVVYCEIERYAQGILLSRMLDGDLPRAPICTDVRKLPGEPYSGVVDIIYGGFPCQDISVAGLGRGLSGERSGLFYEIARLVQEVKPRYVFLENVPAIRTRGLREVVSTLTGLGYGCRWTRLSAAEVGAPHRRDRWFLLAYSLRSGLEGQREKSRRIEKELEDSSLSCWGKAMSEMGRVDNGTPYRVDRIKALGNGVVPLQVETAFKKLLGL